MSSTSIKKWNFSNLMVSPLGIGFESTPDASTFAIFLEVIGEGRYEVDVIRECAV